MTEQSLRIYPCRENSFERELKLLEKADISQRNKELITKFHNLMFSSGCGIVRVAKVSTQLRRICAKLKTNLDKLTKSDAIELVALYNKDTRYSEATKSDYRRALKQFYKWFKDEDPRLEDDCREARLKAKKFYKFLEELSTAYKKKQADPKTIIADEDCEVVIEKGCRTPREKALIGILHESGCRVGEFLNIAIGDIEVKDNCIKLNVDGKTGKRPIFLISSMPGLLKYLDVHPYKDNKQSYLWLSEAQHNFNQPLLYKGCQKLVDRCFKKSGINKRHNLHWFRHSRATILAPKMTEAILCKYMGWSLGSKQVKTYCHLSVKQLEDVVLAINGVKPKEEEEQKAIKCICGALNTPKERYCFRCYKPLKVETVIQDKELVNSEINKTVKFMMEMAKNPEMMKAFEEFKKNLSS